MADSNVEQQIGLERFRQLRRMLPQSIGFGIALSLVCVVVLWKSQQPAPLLAWFAVHVILSIWRLSVLRQFTQLAEREPESALRLGLQIQIGCLISGVVWGVLALAPHPSSNLYVPLFVAFVLAGVSAAGATAMASDLRSALAFQWAVFALMAIRLLWLESDPTYFAMGLTALLYTLFMGAWTRRIHLHAVDLIRSNIDARQREQLLQQREARYRDLAHRDALTGLPNRLSLQVQLPELLLRAATDHCKVAIIYLDLDHFKDINDSRGHESGDRLLMAIATRLRECMLPEDLVVRMGGDEFIVATRTVAADSGIDQLTQRLATSIETPLWHEGESLGVTASMGIAVFPDHGVDTDQLLKNADIALYQAKEAGRNNHQHFAPAMSAAFRERIFLEEALAKALGTEQLFVEYQALVSLESGKLIGLEALLRWRHPERGLMPPLTFIPIAEHCGLVEHLGSEVLRQVCRQLRAWRALGVATVPVAVNISPRQFEGGSLAALVLKLTSEHDIDPALLQIEITETALMNGSGHEAATLAALHRLGVKVLIDDFGIGFSSLNHLKNLTIDGLKIDRSFVSDMTHDERDAAIVSAVIGIAKSLRIGVLAEGVESIRHVEQLRSLGCDAAQGNFLHTPMAGDACRALLEQAGRGLPILQTGPARLAEPAMS